MITTLIAYSLLFGTSFLAATVLPLSSEVALAAVVRSEHALVGPVLVATAGNYIGACTTYWIGRQASQALQRRRSPGKQNSRATWLLRRYGPPALLLSWVPLIGDALVALAGSLALPFGVFSCWVVVGKALRYLVVAWATYALLS